MNSLPCTFNSVWDGGYVISTKASVDIETGSVHDIESVDGVDDDGDEVQTLDRNFIEVNGFDGEFSVDRPDDEPGYRVEDLSAFHQSLGIVSPAP